MSKVVVGWLHSGPRGNWFQCADDFETEANIFNSEEEAQKALDYLGWEGVEIYDLADIEERCGKLL